MPTVHYRVIPSDLIMWVTFHKQFKEDFQSTYCAFLRVCSRVLLLLLFRCCFAFYVRQQNLNISQLLTWDKFKVSKQPPLWIRRSGSFLRRPFFFHLVKQLAAVKNNEAVGKLIWKASKIKQRIASIRIPSTETYNVYKHLGAETAQYGVEIDNDHMIAF